MARSSYIYVITVNYGHTRYHFTTKNEMVRKLRNLRDANAWQLRAFRFADGSLDHTEYSIEDLLHE